MYCELQDLIYNLGQDTLKKLTDSDVPDTIDTDVVDYAIRKASSVIDLHIASVCDIVQAKIDLPDSLRYICVDIASYNLTIRRLGNVNTPNLPDRIERNYKRAIDMLIDIRDGKLLLGDLTTSFGIRLTGDKALFNFDREIANEYPTEAEECW